MTASLLIGPWGWTHVIIIIFFVFSCSSSSCFGLSGAPGFMVGIVYGFGGLQVRYLKVIEKGGYQALPWVRYITTGGEYEIRMT